MRREPRPRLEPKEQMLASMSGATITALTMTPFDVIKGKLNFSSLTNLSVKNRLMINLYISLFFLRQVSKIRDFLCELMLT